MRKWPVQSFLRRHHVPQPLPEGVVRKQSTIILVQSGLKLSEELCVVNGNLIYLIEIMVDFGIVGLETSIG